MLNDLRHALRLVRRNPAFALSVCLMLTLGIGVNVAVFAVVDVALLRPLPYKEPERLVQLQTRGRTYGYRTAGVWGECQTDVRSLTQVFESVEPLRTAHRVRQRGQSLPIPHPDARARGGYSRIAWCDARPSRPAVPD